MEIEPGDLVLIRQQPNELIDASLRDESARKLVPRWSLPCRVLRRMFQNSNRFLVANLLTGREQEVHITDIRAISRPQDLQQRREWESIMEQEIERQIDDPIERTRSLKRFWVEIDYPQVKRSCIRSLAGDNDMPASS